MAERLKKLRLIVSGRVQGVGFRYAAVDEAHGLGLKGWVRNRPSGEVEIVAEGREDVLRMLAAWAHLGPPAAHVSSVHEEWTEFVAICWVFGSDKQGALSRLPCISYTLVPHA